MTNIQSIKNQIFPNKNRNETRIIYYCHNAIIWDPLISQQIFSSDTIITFMVMHNNKPKRYEHRFPVVDGICDEHRFPVVDGTGPEATRIDSLVMV